VLYTAGSSSPLEVSADQVKSIGVPCEATSSPPPATTAIGQKFGIHGSNTIGERLMPMLIEAYAQKQYGARPIFKTRAPEEQDIEVRSPGASEPLAVIDLAAKGSGNSAKGLLDGKALIGMSSRRVNDEETTKISEQLRVNIRAPGNEHVLALDGLAVIVHPSNPIKQLTLEEIARIFAGEVTNWMDVSGRDGAGRSVRGKDGPITVHARDNVSGTWDTFKSLVLEPHGAPKRALSSQATRYESSENLSDAVAKDTGAIGFIGLPYINKNQPIGIASTCGLVSGPMAFTVKTEEYPLARRLYLYSIGTPNHQIGRALLQFALSDEAQKTIIEAGFIDQAVEFEDAGEQSRRVRAIASNPGNALPTGKDVAKSGVRLFETTLGTARRSAVVFRFERGSSDLDAKVVQDIGRLARYLQSSAVSGRRYFIAGFADSDGGWESNLSLATARATRVGQELERSGVRVPKESLLSLSYMAPIACNDTDAGRAKNRRVEVWIE
jgi:phosphate transport system substrate-binding protein